MSNGQVYNADALPWWVLLPLALVAWLVYALLIAQEQRSLLGGMGPQSAEDSNADDEPQRNDSDEQSKPVTEGGNESIVRHDRIVQRLYDSPRPGGPIPSIVERLDRWNPETHVSGREDER